MVRLDFMQGLILTYGTVNMESLRKTKGLIGKVGSEKKKFSFFLFGHILRNMMHDMPKTFDVKFAFDAN